MHQVRHFDEEPGRRSAAKLLSKDEAWRHLCRHCQCQSGCPECPSWLPPQPVKVALCVPKPMKLYSANTDHCGANIHSPPAPTIPRQHVHPRVCPLTLCVGPFGGELSML